MTGFRTPDGRPFYAGNLLPPQDGHGRPGFPRLLQFLHEKWTEDREKVLESAESLTRAPAECGGAGGRPGRRDFA